jgi:4-diphosphocytidyl-2-C-methyl-D-erythritol kinase
MKLSDGFRGYKSFAKINIFLEVIGKRSDSYHDIESLFGRISVYDEIYIRKSKKINIEIINNVNAESIDIYSNLVYKAFMRFKEEFSIDENIDLRIVKNIPVGSGLGGGSSNCAVALKAYSEIFGIDDDKGLEKIASELGSDVMFFLKNCSFALVSGRGEVVEPVDLKGILPYIILIFPDIHISTKDIYGGLKLDYVPVKLSQRLRDELNSNCDIDLTTYLFNRLESVSFKLNKKIEDLKNEIISLGVSSLMSGSGSSVFGLSYDKNLIENAFNVLKKKYRFIYLLKFV